MATVGVKGFWISLIRRQGPWLGHHTDGNWSRVNILPTCTHIQHEYRITNVHVLAYLHYVIINFDSSSSLFGMHHQCVAPLTGYAYTLWRPAWVFFSWLHDMFVVLSDSVNMFVWLWCSGTRSSHFTWTHQASLWHDFAWRPALRAVRQKKIGTDWSLRLGLLQLTAMSHSSRARAWEKSHYYSLRS